jgi:hypothetical protein
MGGTRQAISGRKPPFNLNDFKVEDTPNTNKVFVSFEEFT